MFGFDRSRTPEANWRSGPPLHPAYKAARSTYLEVLDGKRSLFDAEPPRLASGRRGGKRDAKSRANYRAPSRRAVGRHRNCCVSLISRRIVSFRFHRGVLIFFDGARSRRSCKPRLPIPLLAVVMQFRPQDYRLGCLQGK